MQTTIATAEIGGKVYKLSPKTIAISRAEDDLATLEKRVRSGDVTYEAAIAEQISFIKAATGENPFSSIQIDEVDVDDVTIACISIIEGYRAKLKKARMAGAQDMIGQIQKQMKPKKSKVKNKK